MKRTLIHLAVLAVCGRLELRQPPAIFGRVDVTLAERFPLAS